MTDACAKDGDPEDYEEEEEEEEETQAPSSSMKGRSVVHSASAPSLRLATPTHKSPSPASGMPTHDPQDNSKPIRISRTLIDQISGAGSKVRVVRQWTTRGTTAQVC